MRSQYLIAFLMMSISLPALAAPAKGLHKHDDSIATYNYNVPIVTGEESGASTGSTLRDEMDQVDAQKSGQPQQAATPQAMPADVPQIAPSTGNAQPMARPIAPAMAAPTNIAVGAQAPNFQLARSDGPVMSLRDALTNGSALILFTPSSSGYGLQQMQLLQKNQNQFKQLGINTIAISAEPIDSIARTKARYGITYPILSDTSGYVAQQYGLQSMNTIVPALYSIDQTGKVAAVQTQSDGRAIFDLSQATTPLRSQQATATTAAPAPVATAPMAASGKAPIASMSDTDADMAPTVQAPAGQQQLAPSKQMPENMGAPMPPVPSPQAGGGKVNYLPPSNPDFHNGTRVSPDLAI
jgi:peroxiredoxin Q/BCP